MQSSKIALHPASNLLSLFRAHFPFSVFINITSSSPVPLHHCLIYRFPASGVYIPFPVFLCITYSQSSTQEIAFTALASASHIYVLPVPPPLRKQTISLALSVTLSVLSFILPYLSVREYIASSGICSCWFRVFIFILIFKATIVRTIAGWRIPVLHCHKDL